MSNSNQTHLFWGSGSPLAGLAGGGLLIIGSARLAYGIISAGALLWVYGLSVLAAYPGALLFPKRGKNLIFVFLTSFIGSIYLLALWLLSPLMGFEVFFLICLVPLLCIGSGIFKRIESMNMADAASRACSEAAVLGGLIILFSIIREPLGFLSLSLPGSFQGIITIFSFEGEAFLPIRIIVSSAGALLLLGYGTGFYRYMRDGGAPRGDLR
jgi:hypothetical protein